MRASSFRRSTRLTCSAISAALGGRGCSNRLNTSRNCGTVRAGFFPPKLPLLALQEPQGQQRQRHVVVPAHPAAHLVLPQPHLAFAGPEQLLGFVPPGVFIPVAEETGLMAAIGEFVIDEAFRAAATWPRSRRRPSQRRQT